MCDTGLSICVGIVRYQAALIEVWPIWQPSCNNLTSFSNVFPIKKISRPNFNRLHQLYAVSKFKIRYKKRRFHGEHCRYTFISLSISKQTQKLSTSATSRGEFIHSFPAGHFGWKDSVLISRRANKRVCVLKTDSWRVKTTHYTKLSEYSQPTWRNRSLK